MEIANGIGRHVRQVRGEVGLNRDDFGEKIGVSGGAVGNWEAGSSGISGANISAIVDVFGVNPDWLINETGKMFTDDLRSQNVIGLGRAASAVRARMSTNADMLPVRATFDKGEGWLMVDAENVVESIVMPDELSGRGGAYGLRVAGSAMGDVFSDGDYVWVDPKYPWAVGKKVVIYSGDEANGDAIIGILVAYDKNNWTIRTPGTGPDTRTIDRSEWRTIHRIVGSRSI